MAVASRSGRTSELQMAKKWKERESSPEHNKVWTQPPPPPPPNHHKLNSLQKVPVVYYLSRNGQLEHPHFIEVPLSSPHGLYLTDVVNRLNFLRGKGMASMYSWSSKRSYKNGFVWHDLAENDFIHPAHGHEYIVKGSELLLDTPSLISKSDETVFSTSKKPMPEIKKSPDNFDFTAMNRRRRNQSWSAIDLNEYKVYKSESTGESDGRSAADASTQTDDKRRRRRSVREIEEEEEREEKSSTELSKDEISPPPQSNSSSETLETLMKADGSIVIVRSDIDDNLTVANQPSGMIKAGSVLKQLISCGSMSLISHYKERLPRGGRGNNQVGKDVVEEGGIMVENCSRLIKLEDKEYFSGSLIMQTKKDEFPALKRSSSYNADRSSHLELKEKEAEGVKAKCIPRKPENQSTTKEIISDDATSSASTTTSDSQQVSK